MSNPHPIIIENALKLVDKNNSLQKIQIIQEVTKNNTSNTESQLVLAQYKTEGNIWGEAENHLKIVIQQNPTIKAYKLMAKLVEKKNQNKDEVNRWLNKALKGNPDPSWICNICNESHNEWSIQCIHCDTFDSLKWINYQETSSIMKFSDNKNTHSILTN